MAASDELFIPESAQNYLASLGYDLDMRMAGWIAAWWQWYVSAAKAESPTSDAGEFYRVPYAVTEKDGRGNPRRRRRTRRRLSLNPAARACQEWASLLLNEDTQVSVDDAATNEWLQAWLADNDFWPTGQQMVERAFATGTGAWALWADVRDDGTQLKLRTYDARSIIPLSWDDDGVTECAFCSRAVVQGQRYHQLSIHRMGDGGEYAIDTVLFDKDGRQADAGKLGMLPSWATGSMVPTFGIVRPGISNICVDATPYGQSVFHQALSGALMGVETAYDEFNQEVKLTEAMVFMDEQMVDLRNESGTLVPVPTGTDGDRRFVMVAGQGAEMGSFYQVCSPPIRTEDLLRALNANLAMFGDQCGFGQDYFTYEQGRGGLRTATEVVSDNSALMRNVRKHENALRRAIVGVVSALLQSARAHIPGAAAEDFGSVTVRFDDSVITDTQAEKAMMLNEIAAGVLPQWMYLVKFYGKPEDEAKAICADAAVDAGAGGF